MLSTQPHPLPGLKQIQESIIEGQSFPSEVGERFLINFKEAVASCPIIETSPTLAIDEPAWASEERRKDAKWIYGLVCHLHEMPALRCNLLAPFFAFPVFAIEIKPS